MSADIDGFSWSKFWNGVLNVINPVLWAKDLASIFSIRKLIIYAVILLSIGGVFLYGYVKGQANKPVSMDIGYGKEAKIKVGNNYLHVYPDGSVWTEDEKGNKIKRLTAKDVPTLKAILSPIGLQLKPIVVVGAGVNTGLGNGKLEIGGGISYARLWKVNLDVFLTNIGAYAGASYSLEGIGLKNTNIGFGIGQGWKKKDIRGIGYISVRF